MEQKIKDQLIEAARVFAESRMADNWDRKDHIDLGIFYKYFYEYILDNIPESDPWISVKDRLPETSGKYIIYGRFTIDCPRKVYEAFYDHKYKKFKKNYINSKDVTHWKSLPTPPKTTE